MTRDSAYILSEWICYSLQQLNAHDFEQIFANISVLIAKSWLRNYASMLFPPNVADSYRVHKRSTLPTLLCCVTLSSRIISPQNTQKTHNWRSYVFWSCLASPSTCLKRLLCPRRINTIGSRSAHGTKCHDTIPTESQLTEIK